MNFDFFRQVRATYAAFTLILAPVGVLAESSHGLAMYGEPALPAEYTHFPYANPDAPKGGKIVLGNTGSFDSLNPYIFKGTVPWQIRFLTHETLMYRSQDEPFTLYGLLAESIDVADDRSSIEYTLHEAARFSDGSPVTVEDVIWSFNTLGTEGHPRYHSLRKQIETIEQTGPRSVRFTFNTENRELALLTGMRPILKKAQWDGKDFAEAGLDDIPIGSSAYVISDYEGGRFVTLIRNPDHWAKDLPVRAGHDNFDEIKIDFYGDSAVLLEGFRAGEISAVREFNAANWESQYAFPRAESGAVVKTIIPHGKPSGITGFVMNTRRAPFDDWRVRQAMLELFNFEFINETFTGGAQPRITSFFSNSPLAFEPGAATGKVAALLEPFGDSLLPGVLDGYELPVSDGTLRNRAGTRRALALLEEAGWVPGDDGKMRDADGNAFAFEMLLGQGSGQGGGEPRDVAKIYRKALSGVGIEMTVSAIDSAQYTERTNGFDFDMSYYRRALSLSPGNEQRFYWGSAMATTEGSRNWMGVADPAVDAMIDTMLSTTDPQEFLAAVRGLDRLMTAGRYVIPFWNFAAGRIAHVKEMKFHDDLPLYGDGPNYMPQLWWWEG